MALAPGTRLGVYEVSAQIGEGGMGQVFRARDTKLNRDVALKVLPDSVASDPERLARFTREAQTLAALNHPHIAAIYGFEGPSTGSGQATALVMELVEGEDLSALIARHGHSAPAAAGPSESASRGAAARGGGAPRAMDVDDALRIATQIAEALEAAHAQGIIHRDLKPANIKVRADGTVKVLDFGLAKALGPERASATVEAMDSPTITTPAMTQAGMILGTAAYMAPEQARGKVVDKRADIWAFGAVLFEMLTGTRAFPGDDVTDTLAAVVRGEPEWNLIPNNVSPTILVFLRRCLQKDPRQRVGDIHDVRLALEGAFDVPSAPATSGALGGASSKRERMALVTLAVVSLVALALAAIAYAGRSPAAEPARAMQLQLVPPEGFSFATTGGSAPISPDGTAIVMAARDGLWLRSMESGQTRLMPGTEGASYPFWSPDSKNVAFFQQGKLRRVAANGGPALDICAAATARGGTWSKDNVILFAPGASAGLFRVPAGGGTPEIVVKPTPGVSGEYIRYPSFLPDGQHFLFQHSTPQEFGFYLGSLDGSPTRMLRPDFSNAIYAPPEGGGKTGRLLFVVNRETLMSQPFDLGTLQLSGEMSPLVESIGTAGNFGNGAFSVSANGALVYWSATASDAQLTIVDRLGRSSGTVGSPIVDPVAAISPDGRQVAYFPGTGGRPLFLQQVAGGPPTQIANGRVASSAWSPDGRIAFSRTGLLNDLFIKHLDGSAQEEPLGVSVPNGEVYDWSPDGKWMLYRATDNKTGSDLWLLPLAGERTPVVFLQTPESELNARFSPDGKWMAYAQDASVRREVFVQAISPAGPATGIKYRISTAGGDTPRWRRDGKELVYVSADSKLIGVAVTVGATVVTGAPQTLFDLPKGARVSDMTPDAQHFLINVPVGGAAHANALTVVLNWQASVKK